jgi:hypothetical protein
MNAVMNEWLYSYLPAVNAPLSTAKKNEASCRETRDGKGSFVLCFFHVHAVH